jgi:periplasmic protein TonB
MRTVVTFRPETVREEMSPWRGPAVSVGVHAAALICVLGLWNRAPRIAPYKLPGTENGVRLLTYYSPGSPKHAESEIASKKSTADKATAVAQLTVAKKKPVEAKATSADTGSGDSALSGVGEGNINIALQKYFPPPKPDLSALPHGTRGDVILDAVVDQNGKIAELRLIQGLGPAIDDVVIATVKQWSYTPATRNGVPVVSEQELHFHYERS